MGRPRIDLQNLLKQFVDHVYFQPPNKLKLEYPCIVYERDDIANQHADNAPYKSLTRYKVTVIDDNPDSSIVDRIKLLPQCRYNRFYTSDNLNHDVFNLYF